MKASRHRCPHCHQFFLPSIFHAKQLVCNTAACQRQRRNQYHRKKVKEDTVYGQVCRESRQKWRAGHFDYRRRYRKSHPDYVAQNRQAQRRRDQKKRMQHLVKNNLAIDVKRLPAEVWLLGPDLGDLVKNNLAISQVIVFQTDGGSIKASEPS